MLQDLFIRATAAEESALSAPRTLFVFAHPDDETIALGTRFGRFGSALLIHVTDGAPRNGHDSLQHGFSSLEEYRRVREQELRQALHQAGLEGMNWICLQIPDQEASLHLPLLTRELAGLFTRYQPEVVFTHPYEGGHPDHDACAFAVHRATGFVKASGLEPPLLIEAAFYHAGPHGIETGCFLPARGKTEEVRYSLSPEEQQRKQALLACFASQQETLQYFPIDHECFRVAPQYDFHQSPHHGLVFYDHYPWGMTSARFCELAQQADATIEEPFAVCL
jgi:LmbE family N-acetylglucosaminyl deacetylase